MKKIDDLIKMLRGEMSTRIGDRDIVDILEVLEETNKKVEQLEKEKQSINFIANKGLLSHDITALEDIRNLTE